MVMRLDSRQIRWTRIRTATEICRSVLALWRTPGPYEVIGPEILPDLTGMLALAEFFETIGRRRSPHQPRGISERRIVKTEFRIRSNISRRMPRTPIEKTRHYVSTHRHDSRLLSALCMNLWMLLGSYWLKHFVWRLVERHRVRWNSLFSDCDGRGRLADRERLAAPPRALSRVARPAGACGINKSPWRERGPRCCASRPEWRKRCWQK